MTLAQTAREAQVRLDELDSVIAELRADYARISNVFDISSVMNFIREFRDGAFEALSVAAQAEILKSRIRRIVVRENGVYIEIFGAKPEFGLGQFENGTLAGTRGSRVRTVFKMVHREGVEPPTTRFVI